MESDGSFQLTTGWITQTPRFDTRMQGSTSSLIYWIELIEIAQGKRQEKLQNLENQHTLHDFQFTIQVPEHNSNTQTYTPMV